MTDSDGPDSFTQAVRHFESGRFAEAEAACRAMLAATPADLNARNLLAVTLCQRGELAAAIPLLQEVLAGNPGNLQALRTLGDIYDASGQPAAAVELFARACAIAPSDPRLFLKLSGCLLKDGRPEQAEQVLRAAIAACPDSPDLHLELGSVLTDLGRLDDAFLVLRQALARHPRADELHAALVLALVKRQRPGEPVALDDDILRLGQIQSGRMSLTQDDLRPAGAGPAACKICGGEAPHFGSTDFSRSCLETPENFLPRTGVCVHYYRCTACGFLFTDSFDDWPQEQFQHSIYNEDYAKVDPGYLYSRPINIAGSLIKAFYPWRDDIRLLDWGGGTGLLAESLRTAGFPVAETYDPFNPEFSTPQSATFNLITCYETLEHVPDPLGTISGIAARLAHPGLVMFTTLVQPEDIDQLRLDWGYAGPRNGHISLFSKAALKTAWATEGLVVHSLNDGVHIAFKELPGFARPLLHAC